MLGEGERLYPRLVGGRVLNLDAVASRVEQSTSFTRGDVVGVLLEFIDQVRRAVADGDTVRVDGLGTFAPMLGLVEKDKRGAWTDAAGRTTAGRNVRLKTLNFRPDKSLLRSVESSMRLDKIDDSAVESAAKSPYTLTQRTALARQYLEANGYMRVADYARMAHLAHSTAAKELAVLSADASSGIAARGSGSGKIYVASSD